MVDRHDGAEDDGAVLASSFYEDLDDQALGAKLLGLEDARSWRDRAEENELDAAHEAWTSEDGDRRPAADVDPLWLASAGWGVVFPETVAPKEREALEEALKPLLEHREAQAKRWHETFYQELTFHRQDDKASFLKPHGVGVGPVDPHDGVPYYLMLVGGEEHIPHRFQYLLDVQFGIGRIAFDEVEDYHTYAKSVVAAETEPPPLRPEMTIFSVDGDKATRAMTRRLANRLRNRLGDTRREWKIRTIERGGKEALARVLGGGETPSLLLTTSHGVAFDRDHPKQRRYQGAVACQEWHERGRSLRHCFSADDLGADAHVHGTVAFLFGCHTAGTPVHGSFPEVRRRAMTNRAHDSKLTSEPFVSALAKRLLAHPNGGALAVLGHVDRAWTRSFGGSLDEKKGIRHIESLFKNLLDGYPVGSAMDWMHETFAERSTELSNLLDEHGRSPGYRPEAVKVARLWRANNDARNFVVLGDPAVRLAAGPRSALGGMSLLYDRAPESRRPLKRVDWPRFLGGFRPPEVYDLSVVDLLRRVRGTS